MWIYILIGVGVGVLVLMAITIKRQGSYRMLFSDTHLQSLVEALAAARTAPVTTFGGVTVGWRSLNVHSALTLETKQQLAPEAVRFMMGVMLNAIGREATAALILGAKRYAVVIAGPIPSVIATDQAAWRGAGVAAMRDLPIVPGELAGYE